MASLTTISNLESLIYTVRGYKVMLDSDLAKLYGVTTFNLNKAVKRNRNRFPADSMFQLTKQEYDNLIFQFGISSSSHGGRRHFPYAFTQEGVAMLSSVLRSLQAIRANIAIMRAFVKLRNIISAHKNIAKTLTRIGRKLHLHDIGLKKNKSDIKWIIQAIQRLFTQPDPRTKKIGFRP